MPLYEYECLTCGAHFEKRQSYHDAPQADCPHGHAQTRRLLVAPVIVFKGSGFYVTDNRAKNGVNGSSKKSDGKPETTTEVKTETKPDESKVETKAEPGA
jgi:putative FmdB family regulatory protein